MPARAFLPAVLLLTALTSNSSFAQDQKSLLARGSYLVNTVAACGNCHTLRAADATPAPGMFLAGGNRFDIPPGVARAKNLTPDKDTGIGSWTDEQIIRAIREGRTKEGTLIGPPMPVDYYNKLSNDDVRAIVAYLRTVPPVRNEVPESKYRIQLKAEPPAKGHPAPPKTDKVAYGEYLATMAHCLECHTPMVGPNRDYEKQRGAGGFTFNIVGRTSVSRNITSDPETGIGAWTDGQIKRAMTQGFDRDGKKLVPPMPYDYFKDLRPDDLDAIVAFVRTLPPIKKLIEPNPPLDVYLQKPAT
jgi:mono/diheme cytochrome c family protein